MVFSGPEVATYLKENLNRQPCPASLRHGKKVQRLPRRRILAAVPRISGDKDQIPSFDVIFFAADNLSARPLVVKLHGSVDAAVNHA